MRTHAAPSAAHRARSRRDERRAGFSLVEATIVLTVFSLLTAVLAPSIRDFVNDARLMKARSDIQVIAVGMTHLSFDVSPRRDRTGAWDQLDVLVGPGRIPSQAGADTERWLADVVSNRAQSLDDYLVTNQVGYDRYPGSHGGGLCSRGWRGPYLGAQVGPDPWGQRYAVSVRHLEDGTGWYAAVLSPGPDGSVQTSFIQTMAHPTSDDLVIVLDPRQ